MPIHRTDIAEDCSCDYVEPWYTHQPIFARVGDVFHMVNHISDNEHVIPCDDLDFDDMPNVYPYVNCPTCLKLEIQRLQLEVDRLANRLAETDDVPF